MGRSQANRRQTRVTRLAYRWIDLITQFYTQEM
jgi:hypothetical protein